MNISESPMRADLFLVERGLATTRSQAQRLIASGVHWRVDDDAPWKKVAKNGDEIPDAANLQVPDTSEAKYISRGGLKLEGALRDAGVQISGLRCLDVGQSTGGFTDCLLQHGAAQVVGIDVGHGQLHPSLRDDARVIGIEGVNARSLTAEELIEHVERALMIQRDGGDDESQEDSEFDFDPIFDVLTGDLSFISLTLVLPAAVRLLKAEGDMLMLVKPQFELQPGQIGKGGIVRDPVHFAFVEKRLRDCCADLGLEVLKWLDSPIEGGDGNREFFIHARKGDNVQGEDRPLAAVPLRTAPKRVPRSASRSLLDSMDEEGDAAHAGQPGPARSKKRKSADDDS
jgi:23S rRNA (cytidine1920-2'-O)/16S rRNA (cytidine1409-2'-O)-methyltransferase